MYLSSRFTSCCVLIVFTMNGCLAQSLLMNELSSGPEADDLEHRVGWIETAKNALAAPAGQMAVHFAKELISRSAGNSQVSEQYCHFENNFYLTWMYRTCKHY